MRFEIKNPDTAASTATLLFLGWAQEPAAVSETTLPANTFVLYDYADMGLCPDLRRFAQIDVIAWSMGVWAAERFMRQCDGSGCNIPWRHTVAINGTGLPAHDTQGIAPAMLQATLDTWNELTRQKFNFRMFGSRDDLAANNHLMSTRSIEDQQAELQAIIAGQADNGEPLMWDKAYVGSADRIFRPENQKNYWAQHAGQMVETDMPHWPFAVLNDLTSL